MGIVLETLRCLELLADQPPDVVTRFMLLGRVTGEPAGHVFWRAGQSPQGVVVPVTGELAAIRSELGGREVCHAFAGPGDCAGLPCAFDGLPHSEEMRVIRAGEFLVVGRDAFVRFIDDVPAVRANVTRAVGRFARRSVEELDRVVLLPLHERLARFLLEHACVRRSDGERVLLRETQSEIAVRLGSVREVFARAMADLAARRRIVQTRRGLFVRDRAGLCAEAGWAPDDASADAAGPAYEPGHIALRTKRYFLAAVARGAAATADEMGVCAEHVTNFAACIARRCPLAVAARCGGAPTLERATARSSAPRPASDPPVAAGRLPAAPDTIVRSPAEQQAIRRRIAAYRRRVDAIESAFGGTERVPASVSLFADAVGDLRPAAPAALAPSPRGARPRRRAG